MTIRKFHIQAGQYQEEKAKERALKVGKVASFLRENPLSTRDEIFKATGITMGSVMNRGIFRVVKYNGKYCWRLTVNPEQRIT